MEHTTNYNLNKPEETDNVNISDLNENADILDGVLKALQDEVDAKQDELTFDDAPTAESTNPVTSDGIYKALQSGGDSKLKWKNGYIPYGSATIELTDLRWKALSYIIQSNFSQYQHTFNINGGGNIIIMVIRQTKAIFMYLLCPYKDGCLSRLAEKHIRLRLYTLR